ncbi:hypothetical protein A5699_16345 [Mycobacterium sp. E802]|uniref:hypothetical protein n=1 Tax=Mycobacterium sp. E802 TaxID=1834152 RepID=UPI0008003342|nr:hypothetical protein A5699_16345 [Mycobacterium sp. E802]
MRTPKIASTSSQIARVHPVPPHTNLPSAIKDADIVVAAVGRPEVLKGDWIKPGAVVIDASHNPGNVGDVDYSAAAERARLITPVPGCVGPTTIAVLLAQTVDAAEQAWLGTD